MAGGQDDTTLSARRRRRGHDDAPEYPAPTTELPDAAGLRRSRVGGWPLAAALAVLAVVLYAVRYALVPFIFAAAIGLVTDPLIRVLEVRLGLRRGLVAGVLYVVLIGLLGIAAYWIVAFALPDLVRVVTHLPETVRHLMAETVGPGGISLFGHTYTPDEIVARLSQELSAASGIKLAAGLAGSGLYLVFGGFLLLVLAPYFMVSGPRLAAGAIWLIPPERRHSVLVLLPQLVPVLRRYLLGICIVVVWTTAAGWFGFGMLAGLRHAPLLAVAVGLLELIPVVGPLTSACLVGFVAIQQDSLWTTVLLIGWVVALRLSNDNLVGPMVLGQAARLHPVVVILAFVCGAMLFGIVGLLLAVPTAVCIKTTLEHYYSEPIRRGEPQ